MTTVYRVNEITHGTRARWTRRTFFGQISLSGTIRGETQTGFRLELDDRRHPSLTDGQRKALRLGRTINVAKREVSLCL